MAIRMEIDNPRVSQVECLNCGITFLEANCRIKTGHGKYCSKSCWSKKVNTGRPSWNKGITGKASHSFGNKHMLGKSSPLKGKKNPRITGSNHYNWKGGTKHGERVRFRDILQAKIFTRDNWTCQICGQYSGYLQIDHIKSWKDYPELRFDMNNCRTLCMACHYYITFKRKLPQGVTWGHGLKRRIG